MSEILKIVDPVLVPKVRFYNGTEIPAIGLGTFGSDNYSADQQSVASVIYPVYFTSVNPHFFDGLKFAIKSGKVAATWGKVLDRNECQLLCKAKGSVKYQVIYKGKESQFTDRPALAKGIYECAVRSVNERVRCVIPWIQILRAGSILIQDRGRNSVGWLLHGVKQIIQVDELTHIILNR